jgi:FkbM family methyltransferase
MTRLRLVPRFVRSLRKRYIRLVHGDDYFVTNYFGARFLVHWRDIVAREIALQNFERTQLTLVTKACARLRPELFIDVGANGGLYSCVLLRQKLVQRAILFEPDRRNLAHLRANLLMNGLTELADCREAALGSAPGRVRLAPGPASNTGRSQIIGDGSGGYEVEVVRLDDVVALSGKTIAVKIDIEGYELQALAGMDRTLRENRGIVQIETTTTRSDVIRTMRGLGYEQAAEFYSELVFEKL